MGALAKCRALLGAAFLLVDNDVASFTCAIVLAVCRAAGAGFAPASTGTAESGFFGEQFLSGKVAVFSVA